VVLEQTVRDFKICVSFIDLYDAETWTLWRVDQKYLENCEICRWRRFEKISWTDPVRNEGILQRIKQEKNILQKIKRRNDNRKGSFLRTNCLLKHIIEGNIE
jgi:hypothetical protein